MHGSFTTGVSLCSSSSNEAAAAVGVGEELAPSSFTSSSSHHRQENGATSSGVDDSSCSTSITSLISEGVLLRFRVGGGEEVLPPRFHLFSATMSS